MTTKASDPVLNLVNPPITEIVALTAIITNGTIDGTVIGGSQPAAGTFTNGTFNNIFDNALVNATDQLVGSNVNGKLINIGLGAGLDITVGGNLEITGLPNFNSPLIGSPAGEVFSPVFLGAGLDINPSGPHGNTLEVTGLSSFDSPLVGAPNGAFSSVFVGNGLQIIGDVLSTVGLGKLTGSKSYYVAINGSDTTGDGLTPATAWATPQHAWNWIQANIDMQGFTVTVNISAGEYPETSVTGTIVGQRSASSFVFNGTDANPENVTIGNMLEAFSVTELAQCTLQNLSLISVGTDIAAGNQGYGVVCSGSSLVQLSGVVFKECNFTLVNADPGGSVYFTGNIQSIGPGGQYFLNAAGGIIWIFGSCKNITVSNNPTFNAAFVLAEDNGLIIVDADDTNMIGTAVGINYIAQYNGVIDVISTTGPKPDYFPGNDLTNSVPSASKPSTNGGQYVGVT